MYDTAESDIVAVKEFPNRTKGGEEEGRDEPWARLSEMPTFALCGFGQFNAVLGIVFYNKEDKYSLSRQRITERDRLWDMGCRVPISNRISTPAARLQRGAMRSINIPDGTLLVGGILPWSLDA